MFEAIRSGGILMIPIILCGVIATYIIIERCYYFYTIKKRDVKLMYDLNGSLSGGNLKRPQSRARKPARPPRRLLKKRSTAGDGTRKT